MSFIDRIFKSTTPDEMLKFAMAHPDVDITVRYDSNLEAVRLTVSNELEYSSGYLVNVKLDQESQGTADSKNLRLVLDSLIERF